MSELSSSTSADGEQLRMVPKRDADVLVREAVVAHRPIAAVCMFSGGNDSAVLAHRCQDHYSHLFHIDTGTAVPGVRAFVEDFAIGLGKPLIVYEAGDAFRRMVVGDETWWTHYREHAAPVAHYTVEQHEAYLTATFGQGSGVVRRTGLNLGSYPHGFPSPGAHGRAYSRLKERQIEALIRDQKAKYRDGLAASRAVGAVLNGRESNLVEKADKARARHAKVMLLSGKRLEESDRRGGTTKGIETKGGRLFVNPLIDWTRHDMLRYRREHELRQSDVAALLHRSGECNCGAFASAGEERALLKQLWAVWWAGMEALEAEAEALGLRWCRWGGYDLNGIRSNEQSKEKPGIACSSCAFRDQLGLELAA